MRPHALYTPALLVAGLGAALVPVGLFVEPLRAAIVYPMTLVAAAVTMALFLRVLFDPRCRRGIDAANAELRRRRPWPSVRRVRMFDPEWGLFGARYGNRPLRILRTLLFFEFIVALVLTGNRTDLLLLAAASFAVAMMLSIIHVGLNTQLQAL